MPCYVRASLFRFNLLDMTVECMAQWRGQRQAVTMPIKWQREAVTICRRSSPQPRVGYFYCCLHNAPSSVKYSLLFFMHV